MGELFALTAAVCFTSQVVLTRMGIMENKFKNILEVQLIILVATALSYLVVMGVAFSFGYNFLSEFQFLTGIAILFIILDGVMGPLGGLFLENMAVAQIGASRASAIRGSNPLFTTLLAMLFLGENPNIVGFASIVVLVCGIALVNYRSREESTSFMTKTKVAGGLFALLAGLSFAFSQIFRGAALQHGATANTATIIGVVTALLVVAAICRFSSGRIDFEKLDKKSLYIFSAAGFLSLLARFSFFLAFALIPVWRAVAIRNLQPLLAILLSWLLLKKAEKINLRLVLGALMIFLGIFGTTISEALF